MANEYAQEPNAHHDVRRRILHAAENLFGDKGFDATSISDISDAAGVGRALIYYYFKDKRDLYDSIIRDGGEHMLDIANEANASEGTALDKLRQFMTRFRQMHVERQSLVRVAMRAQIEDRIAFERQAEEGFEKMTAVLTGMIQDGIAQGDIRQVDPEKTVHMVLGLVHSLVIMQLKAMPDSSPAENVEFAMSVLANGIASRP